MAQILGTMVWNDSKKKYELAHGNIMDLNLIDSDNIVVRGVYGKWVDSQFSPSLWEGRLYTDPEWRDVYAQRTVHPMTSGVKSIIKERLSDYFYVNSRLQSMLSDREAITVYIHGAKLASLSGKTGMSKELISKLRRAGGDFRPFYWSGSLFDTQAKFQFARFLQGVQRDALASGKVVNVIMYSRGGDITAAAAEQLGSNLRIDTLVAIGTQIPSARINARNRIDVGSPKDWLWFRWNHANMSILSDGGHHGYVHDPLVVKTLFAIIQGAKDRNRYAGLLG
jgi:hypothetical protein